MAEFFKTPWTREEFEREYGMKRKQIRHIASTQYNKGFEDASEAILKELINCRDSFVQIGVDPHFYRGLQFAILMVESYKEGVNDETN